MRTIFLVSLFATLVAFAVLGAEQPASFSYGGDSQLVDCEISVESTEQDARECADPREFVQGVKRISPPRIKCGRVSVRCPTPTDSP